MDPAEAKFQAEALVRAAEGLVSKAREEASSIVRDGQNRVAGIVTDADHLRQAAERDAASTRADAERLLAEARAQADEILAEARAAREEAVTTARNELEASQSIAPPHTTGVDPEYAVQEASEVADRILRVARSEAEARSRTITENARRKAEQTERDARSRVEVIDNEHRQMVRNMQQRELSAKARIRELDTEIARLERLLARVVAEAERSGIDTDPSADPENPREVTPSGIVFPSVVPAAIPAEKPPAARESPPPPVERPRPLERVTPSAVPDIDPEVERVRRSIRRRA